MRVLDVTAPDFDEKFDRAIRLYRATKDKSKLYEHQVGSYSLLRRIESSYNARV